MIRNYLRSAYRTLLPLLYSRARFKLFLKVSLEDVDARTQELASLADYFSSSVRPIPIHPPFGDSMLVVAPHQDDEAIGCGGALALQVRAGRQALVTILQDGSDDHVDLGMARPDLAALRNEESRRAAAILGMAPPLFLGYPNLAAQAGQVTEELHRMIADRKVDAVFVPFVLDGHPDHRTANYILAGALRNIGWNVRVLGYEVWGLTIPNVIVVIDDVIQQKLDMLSCFGFANKAVDYVNTTKGLNMYRSRLLGAGMCQYAECFFEMPRREYVELVDRLQATENLPPR
jgi:N-acetylglucosamine malate deacetylase 1